MRRSSVDAVLCTETLEHVPNLFRAVSELRRVVRPGGWLMLSTPFMWPDHHNQHMGDYWRLTEQAWRFLLQGSAQLVVVPTLPDPDHLPTLRDYAVGETMDIGGRFVENFATGYVAIAQRGD